MMKVEKLYSSCKSADDMEKVLTMLEFKPPSTFDVTTKIEQLKEEMEECGFETSPATEALLRSFGRNAILHTRNCVAQHETLTQQQAKVVRKLKEKIWELESVRLYKKQDLESLDEFMARTAKEALNESSDSADLGYPSTEEEESTDTNVTVVQTSEKVEAVSVDQIGAVTGVIFDAPYVKQQMVVIRESIPENRFYIIKAALRRLELEFGLLAETCEKYVERVKHSQSDLGMLDYHLKRSLMIEYGDILRKSGRYNVLGVIGLVEDGVFPRYPGYVKGLELAVRDYCTQHQVEEKDIPSAELRRLKWLSAASLDRGSDGVLARMNETPMKVFIDWTPEMMADLVARLSSEAQKPTWAHLPGPLTISDQIEAVEVSWVVSRYRWKGYGDSAMYAICRLVPVNFALENNYSWFDSPEIEERRKIWLEGDDGSYNKFCDLIVDLLESKNYQPEADFAEFDDES